MHDAADLEPAIAALLATDDTTPNVTVTGVASVGAVRATVFIDVERDGAVVEAVAQVGGYDESAATTEAALLRLAADAGAPVPDVLAATDALPGGGQQVLVTRRMAGLSVPRQILRSLADAEAGDRLAEQCGTALARVHRVPVELVPGAVHRLDRSDLYGDYLAELDRLLDELPTHHPAIRLGCNWLRRNPPAAPEASTLVHGDFRNGNMLVQDGQLEAMLDWELAHVGDPMEDLAWMCVRMWRFGNDDRPCGGFGSIEALRGGYESEGGVWRDDAFWWWLAARYAWWGIGLARQGAAFDAGLSTSIVHAASGRRVPELEYDLLSLIRSMHR